MKHKYKIFFMFVLLKKRESVSKVNAPYENAIINGPYKKIKQSIIRLICIRLISCNVIFY